LGTKNLDLECTDSFGISLFQAWLNYLPALKVKKNPCIWPKVSFIFLSFFFNIKCVKGQVSLLHYNRYKKKLLTSALHAWLLATVFGRHPATRQRLSRCHPIRLSIPSIIGWHVLSTSIRFSADNLFFLPFSLHQGFRTWPPKVLKQPLNCFFFNLIPVILIPSSLSFALL
jgi:hypothetical protein